MILATNGGGGWTRETVDSDGDAGQFAEVIIDGDDRFHISYATQTGDDAATIKYATRGTGESDWTITEVDTLSNLFYGFEGAREITSIKVDSAGNPWIAYTDELNLNLAVWDGVAFRTETITTAWTLAGDPVVIGDKLHSRMDPGSGEIGAQQTPPI